MDIIFKFGEHYYENDGNSWLSFLLTLLGSFLGFVTALNFDRKARRRERVKEQQKLETNYADRLNYLKILLTEVVKAVEQQDKLNEEFWSNIENDPHELHDLIVLSANDTKRILNLNLQNTFLSFRHFFEENENWLEDLRKMNASVDFIDAYFPEINRIAKSYHKGIYEFSLQYKSYVDNLPDFMAKELSQIKRDVENYKDDPSFKFLNASIIKYHVLIERKKGLKAFDTEFLEPILLTTLDKFPSQPFAEPVMDMCKKARVKLNDIRTDALGTVEEFKSLPSKIESNIKFLKSLIEKIEKKVG